VSEGQLIVSSERYDKRYQPARDICQQRVHGEMRDQCNDNQPVHQCRTRAHDHKPEKLAHQALHLVCL